MLTLTLHILLLLVDITFCIFIFLSGQSDHNICYPRYLLVSTALGGSSLNTGRSGDSGTCKGPMGPGTGPPDTTLPLLLPPASRTSQWSEVEELVEPAKKKTFLHIN